MNNHTELPWAIEPRGGKGEMVGIFGQNNNWFVAEECLEKDAAFIVKAVNNHEKLLDALKCICSLYPKDMSDDGSGRVGFNKTSQAFINKAVEAIKEAEL